jgi:hypothetical protein
MVGGGELSARGCQGVEEVWCPRGALRDLVVPKIVQTCESLQVCCVEFAVRIV